MASIIRIEVPSNYSETIDFKEDIDSEANGGISNMELDYLSICKVPF